ncbi:MAG: protein kinase [Solirubrobacterales bacterium]
MALAPGNRLGPYEILSPLGAGGMGEVYKARDARVDRMVALKVLPEKFFEDSERRGRFEREAKLLASLNHPGIAVLYSFEEIPGSSLSPASQSTLHILVMELLEGETLRSALAGAKVSTKKALEWARQMAQGLAAAHEKGIVHRDLKPENVFVTKDGRIKILDFGLAKLTEAEEGPNVTNLPTATQGTEPGMVMGTLGYMSPEQVKGKPADARSDIFSFGAILYEMLSGHRAFHHETAAETISAILKEDPPDLSVTNQNMPPGLERLVAHCLEKNPEQRFHSAHDLAFDLDSLSGSSAAVTGASEAAIRDVGSRFGRRAAALVVLLLALSAAFFWGTRARRDEPLSFRAFTFRRGTIRSARFAPDGHTIVYGAAWQGAPIRLFSASAEHLESAPIALPDADIFAINSAGDLLISLGRHYLSTHHSVGTLALAPLSGGAPHEILENVQAADFGPDGRSFAVIREVEGKNRLEYPLGTVLCETIGWMSHVRVSPRGDQVAFFDHNDRWDNRGTVAVVNRQGRKKTLTQIYNSEEGLTWSSSGDEIWFSAGHGLGGDSILAVTPAGKKRVVYLGVGDMAIFDSARDGKVLLSRALNQREMMFGRAGEARERDLSWFDWSYPIDLLASGDTVLFSESGLGAGPSYGVFIRRTDGSPAVRIGDGFPLSLSQDGRSAIARAITSPPQIVLLPTGAGEPKTLPFGAVEGDQASWFPDGRRILLEGHEADHGARLYVAGADGGSVRPISGEGVRINGSNPVSPDGMFVTAKGRDGKSYVYPVDGGEPRLIPGLSEDDEISRWTSDGMSLFVFRHGELPAKVVRLNLATGKREPWKEVLPSDPSGVVTITPILLTPDGKSHAYSYPRILSQLFLGTGLK